MEDVKTYVSLVIIAPYSLLQFSGVLLNLLLILELISRSGASTLTYTISRVPCYKYSIIYLKTLFLLRQRQGFAHSSMFFALEIPSRGGRNARLDCWC